ncbi:hypothetical protein G5B37_14765 [Rasiella rasia]|uniref:Uncharacterized protein n=1 Tax=Rasiella rasia TaxID=2744027 RepID=A0A6G6GST2_9FLAO|nr:hypothetical protein [Rasiella rasia]QIE60771.1 hypothetical protein G5B37_14765 [Rasiella rasia]
MKILIKLDLLCYAIYSLATVICGLVMISAELEVSKNSKNLAEALPYIGGFVLFIGIACCIVTYIKIRDTNFEDYN